LDANRDAKCKARQRRRALFTLAVRLTPFAGALQSFPRSVADHKLARGAVARSQAFCHSEGPATSRRADGLTGGLKSTDV
jgi:hypothetical protein